jgi:methionyl-tRNA formyltransferase
MKAGTPPAVPTSIGPSHGQALRVFESWGYPDPKGIGGKTDETVAVDDDGFVVACADGRIKVLRVKCADGPMAPAGEVVAASKLTVNTRLG